MRWVVCVAVLGCGGGGLDATVGPAVIERSFELDAFGIVEARLDLDLGAEVQVAFTASEPVDWNVHVHDGEQVVYLVSDHGTSASMSFAAGEAGDHFVMWQSDGSSGITVEATLTLTEGASFVEWR